MPTPAIPHINVSDPNLRAILQSMKERIEQDSGSTTSSTGVITVPGRAGFPGAQGPPGPAGTPGTNGTNGNTNVVISSTDPSPVAITTLWVKLVAGSSPPQIDDLYLVTP